MKMLQFLKIHVFFSSSYFAVAQNTKRKQEQTESSFVLSYLLRNKLVVERFQLSASSISLWYAQA